MRTTSEIEKSIVQQLREFEQFGLSKPRVERSSTVTNVRMLAEKIAIEVQLEWREFGLFVLIVRLENGKLPDGYFVSHGVKSRKYIERAIAEVGCDAESDALEAIRRTRVAKGWNPTLEQIKFQYSHYHRVLRACLPKLLAEQDRIFAQKHS